MANEDYRAPGLIDLINPDPQVADLGALRESAGNAADMLNSAMASVAEILTVATMNEESPPAMRDIRNVAWLMKELLNVQDRALCIHSNAEYALANPNDPSATLAARA